MIDLIFSLFIEDKEESLRLISLRDIKTKETVAFIFWRNIDEDEMKKWIKSMSLPLIVDKEINDLSSNLNQINIGSAPQHALVSAKANSSDSPLESLAIDLQGWIKIELMCVRDDKTGMKLGSILLAAALAYAVSKEGKSHGILQVAGGPKNVAAVQLYRKFNFEEGKQYFNPPNTNLLVLWDIRKVFLELNWEGFLLRDVKGQKEIKNE